MGRGGKESRYGFTDSYEVNFSQKAYRLKETKGKTGVTNIFWRKDIHSLEVSNDWLSLSRVRLCIVGKIYGKGTKQEPQRM